MPLETFIRLEGPFPLGQVTYYCYSANDSFSKLFQLHAEYDRNNDVYLPHRVVQAYHLSKLIGQMTDPEDFVILCGDMNSEPVDPCYRIIKELPQLNDCWLERGAKVIAK